jgi:hypothetical protein
MLYYGKPGRAGHVGTWALVLMEQIASGHEADEGTRPAKAKPLQLNAVLDEETERPGTAYSEGRQESRWNTPIWKMPDA